jgi:hypothetical protein
MSYTWADFLKEVKKKYPKAKPDKVIKLVKTAYGGPGKESNYNVLRSSWSMNAVAIIYKRVNDPKNKKHSLRRVIRNWVDSADYRSLYNLLHEPLKKSSTDNTVDKHVRNLNDIWISKKGKYFREILKENNGLYPIKYMPKLK